MKYLHFDSRALALMRMCIAAVILLDLGIRCTDLEVFYTDKGVTPLSMIFQHDWNNYFISLHAMSGLWIVQLMLFGIAFFCAAMMFIGYRTRLFTFLSWAMMLSLHNRNLLILQGGDDLLRLVLFWGLFIPWGDRYSCDHILAKTATAPQILTVATIGYLLQLSYIYTGSALLKGPEWHSDHTALYYAYSLDQIAYPFSRHIYYYPELLKKLTFFVFYFELLVPLLFFIPYKHSFFRTIAAVSIMIFHFFNSMSLLIGLFPAIGIATVTGILPGPFMDWLERITKGIRDRVISSFTGYATLIATFIPWRMPKQSTHPFIKNISTAALIFLIVFVFDWNFSNLSFVNSRLSDDLRFVGYGLRLDQSWGMFAPSVFKDDGWYILEGKTKKGQVIDLLQDGQTVSYKKPGYIAYMFKNDRWRKYSENYLFADNSYMRYYFASYYLRQWNENHPEKQIDTLNIVYMKEFTLPDYKYSKPERQRLISCHRQ